MDMDMDMVLVVEGEEEEERKRTALLLLLIIPSPTEAPAPWSAPEMEVEDLLPILLLMGTGPPPGRTIIPTQVLARLPCHGEVALRHITTDIIQGVVVLALVLSLSKLENAWVGLVVCRWTLLLFRMEIAI
jgi:hypothetical protein